MTIPPPWGRYAELRPDELSVIRKTIPLVYLPWGALEWHGPHLPLGSDGIVADALAERLARRNGGVLLPTTWWPAVTLPHRESLAVPSEIVYGLWVSIFDSLAAAGWKLVVVISGPFTQGHELTLIAAAEQAIARLGLLVLALPTLGLVDEAMLDHAGLWESSLMLALRPDLVRLSALGSQPLHPSQSGVIGRDPRDTASASIGMSTLNLAVERISVAISELLSTGNAAPLAALYAERRERYQAYIGRYGADPQDALSAWWAELIQEQG